MTCEDCFFARNGLCALNLDEACPTYRPDHPDGLRPPTQLRFVFRQERRRQVGWAFPTAQEQAAFTAIATAAGAARAISCRDSLTRILALVGWTAVCREAWSAVSYADP